MLVFEAGSGRGGLAACLDLLLALPVLPDLGVRPRGEGPGGQEVDLLDELRGVPQALGGQGLRVVRQLHQLLDREGPPILLDAAAAARQVLEHAAVERRARDRLLEQRVPVAHVALEEGGPGHLVLGHQVAEAAVAPLGRHFHPLLVVALQHDHDGGQGARVVVAEEAVLGVAGEDVGLHDEHRHRLGAGAVLVEDAAVAPRVLEHHAAGAEGLAEQERDLHLVALGDPDGQDAAVVLLHLAQPALDVGEGRALGGVEQGGLGGGLCTLRHDLPHRTTNLRIKWPVPSVSTWRPVLPFHWEQRRAL